MILVASPPPPWRLHCSRRAGAFSRLGLEGLEPILRHWVRAARQQRESWAHLQQRPQTQARTAPAHASYSLFPAQIEPALFPLFVSVCRYDSAIRIRLPSGEGDGNGAPLASPPAQRGLAAR